MRIMDLICSPWAILPDRYEEIRELYLAHTRREKLDLKAWEAATGRPAGDSREPYQVVDGVAVIPIQGVMTKADSPWNRLCGMTSTALARQDLASALADPTVHSVLLWINSPGGQVDGTQELALDIHAARGVKPIVSLADGCMCSAAYYAGAAAERVYITSDTTATGSIGVYATHVDTSRAEEAAGVKYTIVASGKYKALGHSHAPLQGDALQVMADQVNYMAGIFTQDVATFRGVSVDTVLERMAEGRVFLGKQAIEAGLVDGVSSMSALIAQLNQERHSWTPGAGAASQPATTTMEEPMNITREQLQAEAPDLLTALLDEGKALGRADELARVKGCLDASKPGYEAIALEKALDGHTAPGDAALAIIATEKADLAAARAKAEKGGPSPLPTAGDPEAIEAEAAARKAEEEKAKTNDPKARWEADANLRSEFGTFAAFEAFLKREASGQARIFNRNR
jgi:signal peptide peptidase SppA